ncbi:hypothetical protein CGK40_19810 [Vibrio parahaemolyticus]|uniref:Lar family restriction alleviation protein n=1 Tax=Vibrio parahaemolyticus TaxID=670 RepID=UPI001121443D|nr:Lar family restriction alleviation protein [Vibrio parahaemolyticus]TNZ90869.1 hypothetical protein CGK40_19810 [Vibrio parahaemolyticus]
MSELKPCPFCGAQPFEESVVGSGLYAANYTEIRCNNCDITFHCADDWNTRGDAEASLSAQINQLQHDNNLLRTALKSLIETSESNEAQLSAQLLEIHAESAALRAAKLLLIEFESASVAIEEKDVRIDALTNQRDRLVKLLEGLERVTEIWLPVNVDKEYQGEAETLHAFRNEYLSALEEIKKAGSE